MTDYLTARPALAKRTVPLPWLSDLLVCLALAVVLVDVSKFIKFAAFGIVLILAALRHLELGYTLTRWWPLLILPVMALLSWTWSDAPSVAAHYGALLLITTVSGLFLARTVPPSRALPLVFLALLIVCVFSIASNQKGPAVDGLVLVGLVGSKNAMATMGMLLALSGIAVMFESTAAMALRLMSPLGVLVGVFIVITTSSATSQLELVIGGGLFCALSLLHRLRPAERFAVVLAVLLVIAPLIFVAPEIAAGIKDFMVNTLHKDTGLTGRDVLWRKAFELIKERPLLGMGYDVFWMTENPDAQGLLDSQNVLDPHGFHFHNTYLQLAVDLGITGSAVFAVTFLLSLIAAVRQYFIRPSNSTTFFMVLLFIFFGRSATELLIGPLAGVGVLYYMIMMYSWWRPTYGWGTDERQAIQPLHRGAWPLPTRHDVAQIITNHTFPFR
jgi:exopolysaccharide production protein ExoQ